MPTLPPSPSTSSGLTVHARDQASSTMFIGAVPDEWELYSDRAEDYTIGAPIGFGASSIVYAAKYHPADKGSSGSVNASAKGRSIPCALKVLDLDSLPPRALQLLQRETTLMSLSKHPNVLRVRGSWMTGHKLHIALRLMNKGSAADVMHYGWPGGMEEDVVGCILRQALKGLSYLHTNGFIHRDIKAANLLIDDDGTVLLGDLGVAADLAEDTSRIPSSSTTTNMYSLASSNAFTPSPSAPVLSLRGNAKGAGLNETKPRIGKRKSFVGTPCWMAPELIQGKQYDSKADIWSFGITALELSQGRPPRSRESPQRVLLRTIQEDPPTLNRHGGVHKYSRAFKEMVDSCLAKDPAKRPTAEELLQMPFFRAAKKKSYLINTILKDLPPLTQRQERRVVPPMLSANSMDSWDFGATLNSPTTSVYRRRVLEEFVSAEDEGGATHLPGMPFSADDFHAQLGGARTRSSLAETDADDDLDLDNDNDREGGARLSSSPSTSMSSFVSSEAAPSLASSPPSTTAPSSYASSSHLAQRARAVGADAPLTPVAEHQRHRDGHRTQIGGTLPSGAATPVKGSGATDSPTLWTKLKSNVKARTREGSVSSEASPLKDRARAMGFSRKGLLSRTSVKSTTPSKSTA